MNLLIKYNPSSNKEFLKAILKLHNVKKSYLASSKKVERNTCVVEQITKEEFNILKDFWSTPDPSDFCAPSPCPCKLCTYKRLVEE